MGRNYLATKAWQALVTEDRQVDAPAGDFVIQGLVTDEIGSTFTITDLKAKYDDVLIISSVDPMDEGSLALQHWQVGAK